MEYIEPTEADLQNAVNQGYTIVDDYKGNKMFKRGNCVVSWCSLDNTWQSYYMWEQSNGGHFIACIQFYACLEHAINRKDITDQTNRTTMTGKPYAVR